MTGCSAIVARLTLLLLLSALTGPGFGRTTTQPGWAPRTANGPGEPANEVPRAGPATLREHPPQLYGPSEPAKGMLLIAKPSLRDPSFRHAVVLLLDYSDRGAMGVILNRPSAITLTELLPQYPELRRYHDPVHLGGPVAPGSLVLLMHADRAPQHTSPILDKLYVALSSKVLTALAQPDAAPTRFRAYAGYAGWGPDQLDRELNREDWLLWPGDADTVLSDDTQSLWKRLIDRANQRWVQRQLR